ncbi:hypothetical protein EHI48_21560 [Rhizobium sp. WSM1325]|nr:hypothetical protein EHI43_25825 [Rhizobium leguminosarum]RWY65255.1 hypothetical protein EHI46_31230 [Rhizobium leguminosarum]RWY73540.1 hypothetical protein EHI48_21560 [Rhizobium leguminosarum]
MRPDLRENKKIEHFRDSEKNGNALTVSLSIGAYLEDWNSHLSFPGEVRMDANRCGLLLELP